MRQIRPFLAFEQHAGLVAGDGVPGVLRDIYSVMGTISVKDNVAIHIASAFEHTVAFLIQRLVEVIVHSEARLLLAHSLLPKVECQLFLFLSYLLVLV